MGETTLKIKIMPSSLKLSVGGGSANGGIGGL